MSLVSVILPTYNRATLVARALSSVAGQTHADWELIVVDDGSTDHTAEELEKWTAAFRGPQRVEILRQPNSGVSAARNLGALAARGEWLAFLDSDDEWLPFKLERQMALRDKFQWIHGEEIWIRNGVRVNPMKKHKKSGGRIFTRCADLCCVSPSTVMLRREVFEHFGGFREDFPVCEDYDLWLKISAIHEVGFVDTPIIRKYGGHADQLSRQYPAMDRYRCISLAPYLSDPALAPWEREHVARVLAQKSRILLNGFLKRQPYRVR